MRWQYYHTVWVTMVFGRVVNYMVRSSFSPVFIPIREEFGLTCAEAGLIGREGDMGRSFNGSLKIDVTDEFGIRFQYFDLQRVPISSVKSIGFGQVIGDKINICHSSIPIRIHPDP